MAMEGSWDKSNVPKFSREEMISYWKGILEGPRIEDLRRPNRLRPVLHKAVAPVTVLEATTLLKELPSSAPGPDGVLNSDLKRKDQGT